MEPLPDSKGGEEPSSWDERVDINLMPSELFLKFRKQNETFRVGFNFEFYNAPVNEFQGKVVLKPLSPERKWKFIYEPLYHGVSVVSKKIPVTNFLNLQVGIGHTFYNNATSYKWSLNTCFGGDGISRIRNKNSISVVPGMDLRVGWRADYVLPEITGALGTSDPLFNMNSGQLKASLDRVEVILTHIPTAKEEEAAMCKSQALKQQQRALEGKHIAEDHESSGKFPPGAPP